MGLTQSVLLFGFGPLLGVKVPDCDSIAARGENTGGSVCRAWLGTARYDVTREKDTEGGQEA